MIIIPPADESKKAVVRRGIRIPFDCTEAPLSNAGSSSTALLSANGAFGGKHFHENVHVLIKLKDIGDEKVNELNIFNAFNLFSFLCL